MKGKQIYICQILLVTSDQKLHEKWLFLRRRRDLLAYIQVNFSGKTYQLGKQTKRKYAVPSWRLDQGLKWCHHRWFLSTFWLCFPISCLPSFLDSLRWPNSCRLTISRFKCQGEWVSSYKSWIGLNQADEFTLHYAVF